MTKWEEIETLIRGLLEGFEVIAENDEGQEGSHTLTEFEQYCAGCFLDEVLNDKTLLRLIITAEIEKENWYIQDGQCPACGHKAGDHRGQCDGKRLLDGVVDLRETHVTPEFLKRVNINEP